ncbi:MULTISPECIES: alkaline phosphatase family protein [Bacillus]|uniref:Alkaline phosphatase family protein n=1 Tax=Bacillus glycinifermentans TaxID=1664069 RepID=A0AAJ4D2J7_9BACI|nr:MULTISPECIES: alkaline phosphatase family protein [Bacillus]KKB73653.1 phosphodiesterase [Bacillus sp. TH008]MDU0073739.1 alkaline phosphatase family protein [Bacillus sp. IG6]MED8021617.1 alkaline phosphatase family protein [Bacillus glycinifermentans]QAT65578.1 alkaline phosphatase family protein [Bacillus glycinifermentans]WKB75271.1 alkaline phosphatase family protein [Bacillus glycinifermentans]
MKKLTIIAIILLCALFSFIIWINAGEERQTPAAENIEAVKTADKPVIVLIVDSLMDRPLKKAINEGRAPALRFFLEKGRYHPGVVNAYPTMSVSIDSTIMTGAYPDRHRVAGLVWYNQDEHRIVNYGSGKSDIAALGVKQPIKDAMYALNQKHLSPQVKTVHEELEKRGKHSASINGLVYRGGYDHDLNIPPPVKRLGLMPEKMAVKGPAIFSFGRFAQADPHNRYQRIWNGYGLNNKFTAQELSYLIKKHKLPSLTVAYFPDNDHSTHHKGPADTSGLEKTDQQLQRILNAYDSWDAAAEQAVWIVMGDSGQTSIGRDRQKSVIRLRSLFGDYRIPKIDKRPSEKDQLMFGVNDRMAFIYMLDQSISVNDAVKPLKRDERVGFAAWKDGGWVYATSKQAVKPLRFRPGGGFADQYGQTWTLDGDFSVLDLSADGTSLFYGDYPDALARLFSAFHSHPGRYIIADAKPGFQFADHTSPIHPGGGGHGSLYKTDSLAPMIITGSEETPEHFRHVELKDFFLKLAE